MGYFLFTVITALTSFLIACKFLDSNMLEKTIREMEGTTTYT
jgi:hypothetical protein